MWENLGVKDDAEVFVLGNQEAVGGEGWGGFGEGRSRPWFRTS